MFWYLATPYTNYPDGTTAAFMEACHHAALLIAAGVPTFCPIAHTHPVDPYLPLTRDEKDHAFWMSVDEPFMKAAYGAIVVRLPGWKSSRGVSHEIDYFLSRGKPVVYMDPDELPCLATLRAFMGHFPR